MTGFRAKYPSGIPGRVFATLFLFVFFAVGLLGTFMLTRQVYNNALEYTWKSVPCVILESAVAEEGGESPYTFRVHYQYEWNGRSYSSDKFSSQRKSFSDYSKAQRLSERFKPDSKAVCYVNPRSPSEAILQHAGLWGLPFILIPLVFVAIGGGGIYFIWKHNPETQTLPKPIVHRAGSVPGLKFSVLFFGIFFLVGLIAFYFILVRPVIKIVQARDWNPVPCTVVSSRVQSHSSDDGTTYSVDILYSYEVDGREYKANRYNFLGGSSSGYKGKAKIVAQHPPGAKKICFVNPGDPTDAVLHRKFSPVMWVGLVPLIFVAVGVGGIVNAVRKTRHPLPAVAEPSAGSASGLLKPRYPRIVKFLGMLFVSIFWNGIVSVFIFQVAKMWSEGQGGGTKWFLTFFLIPFVLIGLAFIYIVIHSFFGLFSPRAKLRLDSKSIALGDSVELHWEFSGRIEKLSDLRLVLEGREETDEGSGKNRRTNTDVFYTADIIHLTHWNDIKSGSALCAIPPDKMPSDADGDHRVVWLIRLKAKVEFGADLDDEYPIKVMSPAASALDAEARASSRG